MLPHTQLRDPLSARQASGCTAHRACGSQLARPQRHKQHQHHHQQHPRLVLVRASDPKDFGVNPLSRLAGRGADSPPEPAATPPSPQPPAQPTVDPGRSSVDYYLDHGMAPPQEPEGQPYITDEFGNKVPFGPGPTIDSESAIGPPPNLPNPAMASFDQSEPGLFRPLGRNPIMASWDEASRAGVNDAYASVPNNPGSPSLEGGKAATPPAAATAPDPSQMVNGQLPYVPSGAPETTWYCWPEGYLGQSFNLASKLQPRASPLLEDVESLSQFAVRHREMCRYSEHTLDSASEASQMVQAVVGGAVDMGMLNASGSASFQMSRDLSSRSVSHSLVASFQENNLLQMLRPSLSRVAKETLTKQGPAVFAARYGTHFVSGVGHRGAFIGSITVKLADVRLAAGASASFKAAYGKVSTMGELKASMDKSLKTSDVTFTWHKWGVADDTALDLLEQYCGSDEAKFAGMRALAMHTADGAQGYPKLVKLRPYSILPDYVEACSKYCEANRQEPSGQLQDLEQAMAYLTAQYRKASFIQTVIDNDRRLNVLTAVTNPRQQQASLAYRVKVLLQLMETIFRSKDDETAQATAAAAQPSMHHLRSYFKGFKKRSATDPNFRIAAKLKTQLDEVDRLDFELFKAVQRPITLGPQNPNQAKSDTNNVASEVHIAAVSDSNPARPFGAWYLDYQLQEAFTKPGLYLVRLAATRQEAQGQGRGPIQRLEQVGRTQRWEVTGAAAGLGSVNAALYDLQRYLEEALTQDPGTIGARPGDNVFVLFAVGTNITVTDGQAAGARRRIEELTLIPVRGVMLKGDTVNALQAPAGSLGSWAAISLETRLDPAMAAVAGAVFASIAGPAAGAAAWDPMKRLVTSVSSPPAGSMPSGMVMAEQKFRFYK